MFNVICSACVIIFRQFKLEQMKNTEVEFSSLLDVQLAAVQEASRVRIRDEDGIPLLLL